MKIVCVITTESQPIFNAWLKRSCYNKQFELIPLYFSETYRSHKMKDILLLTYINRVRKNEVILFTDAYDTVLLAGEKEILEKFSRFNSRLVFSAEANCWPGPELAARYPESVQEYALKYLNSGGFIGETDFIKYLLEKYYHDLTLDHKRYPWSNQHFWHQIYLKEETSIRLDHHGELFLTLSADVRIARQFTGETDRRVREELLLKEKKRLSEIITFSEGRVLQNASGTQPCHVHFNSPLSKHLLTETDFFGALKPAGNSALFESGR